MTNTTTLADLKDGKKPETALVAFSRFMDKLKPQMALALPKHLNPDRMTRLVLTSFSTTPGLSECSFNSIAGAVMTAAQLGLEPGVLGQGYLIPYKTTCTFVPGWKGLVDLVARSGRATVWTGAVFAGDLEHPGLFDYQLGDAPFIKHKPNPNASDMEPNPNGDGYISALRYVYAVGRVKDSQMPVIEVWSTNKVKRHLKQYNKVGGRHYALQSDSNFEMYARKVVLLQVLKYMPSSVELNAAMSLAHAEDEGRSVVLDGDFITRIVETEPETVDAETGEISKGTAQASGADQDTRSHTMEATTADKPKNAPKGPTYAQVADRLLKAASLDDAAIALDAGRELPPDQQKDLATIFAEREAFFNKG